MKVAFFNTKSYDREFFTVANVRHNHAITFLEPRLDRQTALLADAPAICIFVNDEVDKYTLQVLANNNVKLIALRCAGYNNVDVQTAKMLGIKLVRVPAYSPYAVAEHAVGLILALNRHLHRAYNRVREGNFSLEGLLGFDLHGRTIGVIGTGRVGGVFAKIMTGFGCQVLAYDTYTNPACEAIGVRYVELPQLFSQSDIISLHCPLTPQTYHLVNEVAISQMKPNTMLINTSRGALIDTKAIISALKSGKIGSLGLDVYERESEIFFENLSDKIMQDDTFARLMTFPNVIITGHQAFFTDEALRSISEVTLSNITQIERGQLCDNEI
ncbi:2-hydroxyacid dehydrogenase [Chamaesiphon polymorphus]|uniref:Hydroxyacid dehydrogenase n=1 Tax=Chamaesiphon polymorphus CCALA 037 TaxID=2107692 RepID=A0A2T1G9T9_9CYAN|nr:2-hydroxyacid dehydrogenase [Chamaesiphon polymorphus]PSB54027.1 hydroxyacid dehydrogenase [Chamaesiphon polymorphus CCALA 037]